MQKERVHCFQSEKKLKAFISIYNEYHKTLICMQKDGLQVNESLFESAIEKCSEIYYEMVEKYFDTYDYYFLEFINVYVDDFIVIEKTINEVFEDFTNYWIHVFKSAKNDSALKCMLIQGFDGFSNSTWSDLEEEYRSTFGYEIEIVVNQES